MGFLKEFGAFTGKAAGFVVGGAVHIVGEATGSKFIQEVGTGVKRASEFAGETLGQAADGAWDTAAGLIQKDEKKVEEGLGNIGNSVSRTAKGVYVTAKSTYYNGKDVYEGFKHNDDEKIKAGVTNIAKTVAVGVLAVGVVDLLDGPDIGDPTGNSQQLADGSVVPEQVDADHSVQAENANLHHVQPHWVEGHWRDGQWIEGYWRDGDGNTAVNVTEQQGGGYMRTSPDGIVSSNLRG